METKQKGKKGLRPRRHFSVGIKKQVVRDIEKGKCTVLEASRELGVSFQTVYVWLYKYSLYLQKNKILIVEDQSEAYRSKDLEKRILELEAVLGRKQMEIDLLNKVIELANGEFKTDLKKSMLKKPLDGSGSTKGSSTSTR
jgi:transposase-like protein